MAGRIRENVRRLAGDGRVAGVDLARGLAVIGMLAAHLLDIEAFSPGRPETWVDIVNGRSSILFAVLAGVSIALSTGGPRPIEGATLSLARRRLAVRAAALWVIGILLIMTGVPIYVILPAYAILFLIAIPLLRLRAATLFVVAAALLMVMPFVQAALDLLPVWSTPEGESLALVIGWPYPFPLWSGFVVLGLALGRIDLGNAAVAGLLLAAGTGLALVAYGLGGMLAPPAGAPEPVDYLGVVTSLLPHSGGVFEVVGGAAFAAAVLGASILLCRVSVLRAIVLPLRATGSMPLTAYTAQVLIWAGWALVVLGTTAPLTAFRELQPFWPITVIVVAGCTVWAAFAGRGPLETALAAIAHRGAR